MLCYVLDTCCLIEFSGLGKYGYFHCINETGLKIQKPQGVDRWQGWDLSWGLSCFCVWCPCYFTVRSLFLIQLDLWVCAPACKTRLELFPGRENSSRGHLPQEITKPSWMRMNWGKKWPTQASLKPENFLQGPTGWVLEEPDSENCTGLSSVNRYRLGVNIWLLAQKGIFWKAAKSLGKRLLQPEWGSVGA